MMMKTLFSRLLRISLAFLPLLLSVSCERTFIDDLFDIHKGIDELKESHSDLQQRMDNLNESLVTIQAIVDMLASGYFIDSVETIVEEGLETGFLIHFTNGKAITISHGKDASDGHSPAVGVTLVDGVYYWTLDGQPIIDDEGNMVPTSSNEVKTPLFSISNGYWYMSLDGGDTWRLLGRASGEDGDNGEDGVQHFIRVEPSDSMVVFVLADGTSIAIPYRIEIDLSLDSDGEASSISGRETIRVGYTLSNATENTVVNVSSDGYYSAKVIPSDDRSGIISITCPRTFADGFVNVIVHDKAGVVDTRIIRFYEKQMTFAKGLEFSVPPSGGGAKVPFKVNFPFHTEIDPSAASWLSILEPAEGYGPEDELIIQAQENAGTSRTGTIYLVPDNSDQVFAAVFITQQSLLCTIDIGSFLVPFEGGTFISTVKTGFDIIASVPAEDRNWLKAEVLPAPDGDGYSVAITVEPNPRSVSRSSVIDIDSSQGFMGLASIMIRQNARNLDLEYALVFVVNPNYSNDFTAYLPIDIYSYHDCFVDWGDGTGTRYKYGDDYTIYPEEFRNVHHKYEGLTIGRSFEVVVTGTVTSLYSGHIPAAFRSSVTEVKQWGKTGLTSMNSAFDGFTGLTTLHLDETGAFENVESFDHAFSDCPRLITISEHLFDHAVNAKVFDYTFEHCHRLAVIPENLFKNTAAAESFTGTFSHCYSLVSLPEGLFRNCPHVSRFDYLFLHCRALLSVPERLFADNPHVKSFAGLFLECYALPTVPAGLFAFNTEVYDISSAFDSCYSLSTIPPSIFDSMRRITYCDRLFQECRSLESESPSTLVDGKKIHLYERKDYPDLFVDPWSHRFCFFGCNMMQDYESLQTEWTYE